MDASLNFLTVTWKPLRSVPQAEASLGGMGGRKVCQKHYSTWKPRRGVRCNLAAWGQDGGVPPTVEMEDEKDNTLPGRSES